MARQPARSAFLLTTIAVGFTCFLNQHTRATTPVNNHQQQQQFSNSENINSDKYNIDSGLPKFGDRISPRPRPFLDSTNSDNVKLSRSDISKLNNVGNKVNYSSSLGDSDSNKNIISITTDANPNNKNNPIILSNLNYDNSHYIVNALHKKSIIAVSDLNDENGNSEIENTDIPIADVDLPVISDNQLPYNVQQDPASNDVNASSLSSLAEAHRLEMSTEFFVVPSTAQVITRSSTIRPGAIILAGGNINSKKTLSIGSINNNNWTNVTPPTIISTHNYGTQSGLRKEPWVVPVLVLSSLSMMMMAAFEVFVLCKAWRTSPSRRHLFLGQMLLLGLFACVGLAAILTATPNLLSCATIRFGTGVAFALVFASLLVKCVFLISLNGGVYLPAPYQGLLLLFAVLIQVAVGAQWLLTSPPALDNIAITARSGSVSSLPATARYPLLVTAHDLTATIQLCKTPFSELLFSLIYVVFLILFVAVLAIKSRGIRDNYREATYIGLAIGGSIPIWIAWTLCGLAVADQHKDACLAFGLVATSSTVFLVMFMPKGRQLAAMGKEGLYVEDREEQFSSLSRAGSGYSPSFFHFKPIKYGIMGPAPTSTTTNTANITNSKHQAVATLGGGKLNIF